MRRCSLEQSKWSWDECRSICINTRKNNGSSRLWVGDDQEVFTGAVRVKSWEVEGWSQNAAVILGVSIQEWTTVPAGCEWAMIRRCSLEQSEWSPEKLKVEAGRRLSFYLYQFKKITQDNKSDRHPPPSWHEATVHRKLSSSPLNVLPAFWRKLNTYCS